MSFLLKAAGDAHVPHAHTRYTRALMERVLSSVFKKFKDKREFETVGSRGGGN